MLDKLFGSKTRVLLLRLFLNNPDKYYFVRELARNLDTHLNSIRRELENLEDMGIIISVDRPETLTEDQEAEAKDNKKYYRLNTQFIFIDELRSLFIKSHVIMEQSLIDKVEKIGDINLFLLSGVFVGREDAPADLLVVGTVNKAKLLKLVGNFERELGRDINYTVMSKQDFLYRRGMTDKFIFDLLENKNLILINRIKDK